MTQQNPIFLDYFYKQLLSLTYGSVYRYHSSHNNCFDTLIKPPNSALTIQSNRYNKSHTIHLPILDSLSVIAQQKQKKYSFKTFKLTLKHFFIKQEKGTNLFEDHYFTSQFVRSLSKTPFNAYRRLTKTKLPSDINPFLVTISTCLTTIINTYDTNAFWACSEHKRYLNRLLTKSTSAKKNLTLDFVESFFSLIPTLMSHLEESSKSVYEVHSDNPDSFASDCKLWNHHLNHVLVLFRATVQAFLILSFYKLHYYTVLLSSIDTISKTDYDQSFKHLITDLQTKLVYSLCFQQGLLTDIIACLQSIFDSHSSYSNTIQSFSSDIKESYFDVKNNALDYIRSLKHLTVISWVDYFNLCFSNKLSPLALSIIRGYHDIFPSYEFSEIISDYFTSYETSIAQCVSQLPESIQNQSNQTIKVDSTTHASLHHNAQNLYFIMFWSNILSFYLSLQGRYSLMNDCAIIMHQHHSNSVLSSNLLIYFSISLTSTSFNHYIHYLAQLYPQYLLRMIDSAILLHPSSDPISLQHDAYFATWYNSIHFINRWVSSFRSFVFNSSSESWKYLYPYMTYSFLSKSQLINDWIQFAPTHVLERECLTKVIHYISTQTSHDVKLFNLFVRTQHIPLDLAELNKIKLSYSLTESTLCNYVTNIKYLYKTDHKESFYAIDLLCFQLIDYCDSLHSYYCADILSHLINPHLDSLMFIMSITLQHHLSSFRSFINFLGMFYSLFPSIKHAVHTMFPDYLGLIKTPKETYRFLQQNHTDLPCLSQLLLTDLMTYFSNDDSSQTSPSLVSSDTPSVSQTYLTLHKDTSKNTPLVATASASDSYSSVDDPFFLILELSSLLTAYYSKTTASGSQGFELIDLRASIKQWIDDHQSLLINYLDGSLCKSLLLLIQYAYDNHHTRFLNQRSHLMSLLFSLKSISHLQKILMAHIINVSSCLVDLNTDDSFLYSPSLYVLDFDSITNKGFLHFCLHVYQMQLQDIPTFSISEFDILVLQKILSKFKDLVDDFEEADFIFLELLISILTQSLKSLPDHASANFQSLFSILNNVYDFIDIIPDTSSFLTPFIYKILPVINDLLDHGFINYFHPFFTAIISLHDTHPHPSESLSLCHQFLNDYHVLLACLSLNKPMNFNLFEAIIQKPYIQHSLPHFFSEMPGMCLSFSLFLLTSIQTMSTDDDDHSICFFLNHIFHQNLDFLQWQQSYFFFHLLKTFYDYSPDSTQLDHMMGLSLKDHDKLIISSLLLTCPQQAKQLILRLQDLSQSSHPLLKNLMVSLLDHALHQQLNDPLLTLNAVSNHSLKECLVIKSEIDQNITYTFQQLNQLVTTYAKKDIRSHTLESFILKATTYLKNVHSASHFLSKIQLDSPRYICQLFHIIRIIDDLNLTISHISHEMTQQLCRHICHIIARIILDPLLIKDFESDLTDYFFSTHQSLLLDELKTIIMDQAGISFQQVHSILSLLQHSPEQLSYSRFSQWFTYLDILSVANEADLILILYECCLVNGPMTVDIIKAQQKPSHYLEYVISHHTSLAFYMLNLLQQSPIEADQSLFSHCSQSLKSHPFLSYFNSDQKTNHPIHEFISHIYNTPPPSMSRIPHLIYDLIPDHHDYLSFYLELLYLNHPNLFWVLCQNNEFGIYDSIVELLLQFNHDSPTYFSINIVSRWLSNPLFLTHIPAILEKSRYTNMHALLVHASIIVCPSSIKSFSDYDIVSWISYCFQFNKLTVCFSHLQSRDYFSADCFYLMFFNKKTQFSFNLTLLLDYLDYLDDISLASFISNLDDTFHVSYKDFTLFILKSISSLSNHDHYSELLIRCTPYLRLHHEQMSVPSISSSSIHMLSYASLCYVSELSLADICKFLKQCNFVPSLIISDHIKMLSDAIVNSSKHHFLTDLSLHYPTIFYQLFFHTSFANTIQQALYYKELTEESLLYTHIINAIDSFNYIHLLQFLALYSKKHLTSQKQSVCFDLLDSFLPFSSDNVRHNFDDLATTYQQILNTPIPRLSVKDPILQLIFNKLPQLRQNLHITEQLYCFLSTSSNNLAQHGIDAIHVKKQLEICCNDVSSRLLLLSSFYHPSDHKSMHLFCSFIHDWEEKNSLYDTFNLYLHDHHEHHLMYDYLLFMTRLITRFSFKHFKLSLFKQLCLAIHFLLTYSPDKTYLNQWFVNSLIPNMKSAYFPYLAPVFSSKYLDQKTLSYLTSGFITHQKTACYAPLFKACFLQPSFSHIWEYFISHSKKHIILSDLLVETSALHTSIEIFLRNFVDYQPKSLFYFCSVHYHNHIFIDIFFKKLYDHYFANIMVEDTSVSLASTNPFIHVTQLALQNQETGFLFFLARCIENYLIPNKKNVSWFIHLLSNLYRISLASLPHDMDSSMKNMITKLFINSGIILDTGEFLLDLPSLNLDQFSLLNPDITLSAPTEFAFINLQQASISSYQQRYHVLDIFIKEAPSFFIRKTSMLSSLNRDTGVSFLHDDPAYLDYLFNVLLMAGNNPLALQELFTFIIKHPPLKSQFFDYIKIIPSDSLLRIISNPYLSIDQRHFILYSLLHDEKGCYNKDNSDTWENRVVHTLLSDLTHSWITNISSDNAKPYIEILLFFFIYFPNSIESFCFPYYMSLYKQTGICIPKLFSCKEALERLFSSHPILTPSLDTLRHSINDLLESGFSLFEILVSFRASVYFNASIEQEWLSFLLTKETSYSISYMPSWFLNIFDLLCIKQTTCFVSDSFFETSINHQAFKRWLIKEGHLSTHNILSLTTLDDFLKYYDPYDVYHQLADDISSMISTKYISKDSINLLAKPFFESLFYDLSTFSQKPTIHVLECSILLDMIEVPSSSYEKAFLIRQLGDFQQALYNHHLSSLLNVSFMPYIMCLLKTPSCSISLDKKDILMDSIPIFLDLSHSIFSSLSEKQKSAFKLFLVNHDLLQHNIINRYAFESFKKDSLRLKEYYDAFLLLDKYMITQQSLLESALITIAQLGFILLYPEPIGRIHFLNQFASILDHEWVYITHFLNQSIDNETIESRLKRFIKQATPVSKDLLKNHALTLKNTPSDGNNLSSLFIDFQKHTQNFVSSPHSPSIHCLLEELMSSIIKTKHVS